MAGRKSKYPVCIGISIKREQAFGAALLRQEQADTLGIDPDDVSMGNVHRAIYTKGLEALVPGYKNDFVPTEQYSFDKADEADEVDEDEDVAESTK